MFNRKLKYSNKLAEELKFIPFYCFGIQTNDNFNVIDISKHVKTFNKCLELENELNKLATYIYDGKRKIVFHEFREFPYIVHGNDNLKDICGLANNYTSADVYLIKFIKKFLLYQRKKYVFFDVDFIIQNTRKIEFKDCSIIDMPIDEILN